MAPEPDKDSNKPLTAAQKKNQARAAARKAKKAAERAADDSGGDAGSETDGLAVSGAAEALSELKVSSSSKAGGGDGKKNSSGAGEAPEAVDTAKKVRASWGGNIDKYLCFAVPNELAFVCISL